MDEALVFLILLVLALIVSAILGAISFFRTRTLRREIASLRADLRRLHERSGEPTAPPEMLEEEKPNDSAPLSVPEERVDQDDVISQTPDDIESEPPIAASVTGEDSNVEETKTSKLDLEQAVGGKWAVWVGGLALAIGAVFLVRYSIDQGLLSPKIRVLLGFAFSASLAGLGEWTRRRGAFFSVPGFDSANIPATLTAAGSLGLFASMYVAYGVYGFLGPALAFIGMGLVAVACLVAALLHGPALAALGLIGAYGAPFLVSTEHPVPWSLAIYVLFVSAVALVVARWRAWRWLAITAGVALILFAVVITAINHPLSRITLDLYLLTAFAMVAYTFVVSIYPTNDDTNAPHAGTAFNTGHDWPATLLLSGLIIVSLPLTSYDPIALIGFVETMAILVGGLVLVYRYPPIRLLIVAIILTVSLRYLSIDIPYSQWGRIVGGFGTETPGEVVLLFNIKNVTPFFMTEIVAGMFAFAIAYWAANRSRSATMLAIAGTLLPILLLIITWLKVESFARSYVFFAVAIGVLGAFVWATQHLIREEQSTDDRVHSTWPATIFIVGAFATLALAVSIILEKGFLTIALALIVPAVAYVQMRRPMPGLKQLALCLMALWILRVIWDPSIIGDDLGTTPLFNWLLYGWGLSSLAFAGACYLFVRDQSDLLMDIIEGITIAVIAITIALLLTHAWDPQELFTKVDRLGEAALLVLTGGGVALGLLFARRNATASTNLGIDVLGYGGMAGAVLMLLVWFNPVFTAEPISGGLVLNVLTLTYLIPALLYGGLAWFSRDKRPRPYTLAAFATSGLLGFMWISLIIRFYFHPGRLDTGGFSNAELYTYSIVWLIVGVAVLAAGLVFNSLLLRKVSAGLILLVVLKAFLVDMSGLTGILRALSFIGLGGVLIAVGLVYQRLLSASFEKEIANPDE